MRPTAVMSVLLTLLPGCAHELSPEERLDRATQSARPHSGGSSSGDVVKMRCNDAPAALARARLDNQSETARLVAYNTLYVSLKLRSTSLESALRSNPDLVYQTDAEVVTARDLCAQQTAEVRGELERFVRDLIDNPTSQDVKGGVSITVARVDFEALRKSAGALGTDDHDLMLARINAAERRVKSAAPVPAPKPPTSRRH